MLFMPVSLSAFTPVLAAQFVCRRNGFFQHMLAGMLTTCHEHQVFRAIIAPVVIYVVDYLMRLKQTLMGLFPYKAVLKNVTNCISGGMFMCMDVPVTRCMAKSTTFPLGMGRPLFSPHRMSSDICLKWVIHIALDTIGAFGQYLAATAASAVGICLQAAAGAVLSQVRTLRLLVMTIDITGRVVFVKWVRWYCLTAAASTYWHRSPPAYQLSKL